MEAALLQGLQDWNQPNKHIENKEKADDSDTSDSDDDSSSSSSSSSDDEEDEAGEGREDPEEMSKRLGAQLWAEITKAKGLEDVPAPSTDATGSEIGRPQALPNPPPPVIPASSVNPSVPLTADRSSRNRKQETAVATIKAIMSLLEKDPVAHTMLATTAVPLPTSISVLSALKQILTEGKATKQVAGSLSQSLIALAGSEALFGKLRHSSAPSMQLDLGKRKRDHEQDGNAEEPHSPAKRRAVIPFDLFGTVSEAVRVVGTTLQNSIGKGADPTLISSLQTPLHQIFMFAVKSSTRGGIESHILQEVAGLVQVLGVLSGIPIGQNQPPDDPDKQESTDIGTAVYPCTMTGCRKTFARLFSLRSHERAHSSQRRYVCKLCPAAFIRNHDLKRHSRLHEKKVWKCIGCSKVFSRRDAIKRHRNAAEARGVRGVACVEAEPIQVEVEQADHEHAERRGEQLTKIWSDHAGANTVAGETEEGEIPEHVIQNTQGAVMQLQYLLQSYVAHSAGGSLPPSTSAPPSSDPAAGQATLASVIARAQSQNQAATNETTDVLAPSSEAPPAAATTATTGGDSTALPSLSMYGLSDEQAKMLEEAITNAALAAQAQAEAEAALEEEDSDDSSSDDGSGDSDDDADMESIVPAPQ
ncbi:hypothetical protein AAF712_005604 [Marasmius tenuissimus]|uniref:C2H2-type domain-containing protein n=1 Tax=Marasmius tenuissimus TaxID=585030 RepID=A0ABR3A0J1_9AGAR